MITPKPLLSVIIPVRNGGSVVARQLDALAAQDASVAWELVVVDNGSTDDTAEVVRRAARTFPVPLRLVDASDRAGLCVARNVGASAAAGDLLAFCDADDRVGPDWIDAAAAGLADADLIGGELRELTEPFRLDSPKTAHDSVIEASYGRAVSGCNFAVRRSVYFDVGGFDEALPPYGCDDVEFSLRVNAAGARVMFEPSLVVYFQETTGLRATLRKVYRSAQAETVVWALHPDRYGHRARPRALGVAIARLPLDVVAGLRAGRGTRSLVRLAVTRIGNLAGYLRFIRPDRGVDPQHVSAPLDPR